MDSVESTVNLFDAFESAVFFRCRQLRVVAGGKIVKLLRAVRVCYALSAGAKIVEMLRAVASFFILSRSRNVKNICVLSTENCLQTEMFCPVYGDRERLWHNDPCLRSGGEFETTSCPQDRTV